MLSTRPTGLVPDEDQGYVFAVVQLPAGASLERTNAAVDKLTKIANEQPGIDGVASISGFNLLTGSVDVVQRNGIHPLQAVARAQDPAIQSGPRLCAR